MKYLHIYKRGTRLARIARQLGIPVCYPRDRIRVTKNRRAVLRFDLNWGCLGDLPMGTLNAAAINAARKVRAFERFDANEVPCPEWSREYSSLHKRLSPSRSIFCRRDGLSGGEGIEIISAEERSKARPSGWDFYAGRISYLREFRIHVWNGRPIVEQVKFIQPGSTSPIHNHTNGAKFSTQSLDEFLNAERRAELRELAVKAVGVLDLFFGAVDVIQSKQGKFYVLEVNTAPGVRSDPVEKAYKNALKELIVENVEAARPRKGVRGLSKPRHV